MAGPAKRNQKVLPLASGPSCAGVRYLLRSPFGPACGCYSATLRFAPSPLQGSAYKGHPWPFERGRPVLSPHPCGSTPYATIPLTLLMGRLESPDSLCIEQKAIILDLHDLPGDSDSVPVRRPTGGVAQGDARHGRRARNEGIGTSLRDGPRSGTGRREPRRSRGRMPGALSLWLLSLSREQRESDSAGGRNQKHQHTR